MTSLLQKELSKKLAEGEMLKTLADWKVQHDDAKSLEKDH